jgi:GNAT superfamily N-acetyltransferase
MTRSTRGAPVVRAFEPSDIDAAAALLADRQRRHRLAEPLMDAAFEDPAVAGPAIETALAADRAGGWAAMVDGRLAGYLIGFEKGALWGANVWVEAAGHAAIDPSIVRELYAAAAGAWVAEGRTNHHVLVPASDDGLVGAWFGLGFGQQHVHAARPVPDASFAVRTGPALTIRSATADDVDALVELERVLPGHVRGSPVFSNMPDSEPDEARSEIATDIAGSTYHYWVAQAGDTIVGSAIGCSLDASPGHQPPNRPANAALLGYAAVLPEARGLGAGRALGETVLAWARDAGYASVAADWRSANREADGAWRSLGFRPTFLRLHRLIG